MRIAKIIILETKDHHTTIIYAKLAQTDHPIRISKLFQKGLIRFVPNCAKLAHKLAKNGINFSEVDDLWHCDLPARVVMQAWHAAEREARGAEQQGQAKAGKPPAHRADQIGTLKFELKCPKSDHGVIC